MRLPQEEIAKVSDVKDSICSNVGKNIEIKAINKQGRITNEYLGEIIETYENVFLVKIPVRQYCINKSFAYADLVTHSVSYRICE